MVLGLLPSIRGGLRELAKTGQHSRLIEGYLKPYARAFEEVRYFSYLRESLHDYADNAELTGKVRLLPGTAWHPWLYAFFMPFRYWAEFGGCQVFRVFQITGVVPALLAKWLRGIPFVTTYGFWYAELSGSGFRHRCRGWVETCGLKHAAAVIVTTPELAAHVAGKVGSAKVHLIPNGVDTSHFCPAPRPPNPVKQVLYVGRLSQEKNLSALIAAAAKLDGRIGVRLVFIGQGFLKASLEAQARIQRVDASFLGTVDHRLLPQYFRTADAFVLPSLTEGHPKVLLEAMSCGVPCLASARGGNLAIVANGKTGLLFDPEDAGALAECLERVLTQEELARSLAEGGRAAVVARYDLGVLVKREIDLLKRVVQGGCLA
jgi:glycosyltransferase involved in cell wall biosynthesis